MMSDGEQTQTFDLTQIGLDSSHPQGFVWSRPQGLGQWMFVHFSVPTLVDDQHGRALSRAGDCLILDPQYPHWHAALDGPIRNDWFWAKGTGVGQWASAAGLPLNQRFHPRSTAAVAKYVGEMLDERARRPRGYQRRLCLVAELLFLDLGRALPLEPEDLVAEQLREVRAQVHARLQEPWTVASMAQLAGLRPERFALRYRRLFQVSPVEDLLATRLHRACVLLAQTGGPLATVAAACGFRDVPWFCRCFRSRFACSPGAFARGRAQVQVGPRP